MQLCRHRKNALVLLVRRLGDRDFFSRYAAQGRRNGTQRVVLTPVAGVGGAAAACPVAVLVRSQASQHAQPGC